jgi:hypothetical protein
MASGPSSLSIQIYGFHSLKPFREASIRLCNEHGVGVLAATVTGDGESPGYFVSDPAPQCGGRPTADHELSDAYDLIVEVRIDDHEPVAALVVAPHMSTVINRKIVPRLANTEFGAVAVAFVVSPADETGYRARLTALMELVDPDNLSAIDDIASAMDEPAAFSYAWQEYSNASVSLPFAERARNLAERYEGLQGAVDEFLAKLETAEPETVLGLFVEDLQLKMAVLEEEDQMPAQRVSALVRKYNLDEAEVLAGLEEAEEADEFMAELREMFGAEPCLNDPVYAVTTRIAMPEPPAATAANDDNDDDGQDAAEANEEEQEVVEEADAVGADGEVSDAAQEDAEPADEAASGDEQPDPEAENADEGAAQAEAGNSEEHAAEADAVDGEEQPADGAEEETDEADGAPRGPRDVVGDALGDLDPAPEQERDDEAAEACHVDPAVVDAEETGPAPAEQLQQEEDEPAKMVSSEECEELRRAMVGLGQERDRLEETLCLLRAETSELRENAESEMARLNARIAELDVAIEGYRDRCAALEAQSEADTVRIADLETSLAGANTRIDELVKSTARLVEARADASAQRMRLTVKVGTAELMIPAQANIAVGDLRRAVLQRAVRLGTLTQHEAEQRNLQLFLGQTVLFDDDTLDEMGIDGNPADVLTLEENAAVSIASPVSAASPAAASAAPAITAYPATTPQQLDASEPTPAIDPREFVVHLDADVARELASHESLDRRLMAERERIESEDITRDRSRHFDATVKKVLDLARAKLVDRAAYSRTEEHRSQARAAISRIDSSVRAGMTPDAMLGVARHAELTAGALDTSARGSEEHRRGEGGVLTTQDVDMELPTEMQQRIERRRTQCVNDLKEMIETLQSRIAIRPDMLGEAEALLSKSRSYVSLARSLSVEELQTCLRETMNFVASCRR